MRRGSAVAQLDQQLAALSTAVDIARGRLDEDVVDSAAAVVERAGARLGLGLATTVVALAGATGSGKSTLFNALVGEEVSAPGVRRPTTGATHAAVWPSAGGDHATALLDWLGVSIRHDVTAGHRFEGLALLDLPDFDSIRLDHRAQVDRLVELVDLLVWVVDPQKYADAALHQRYLRPLGGHAAVMVVVLNQVDRLSAGAAGQAGSDLQRLLAQEGLRSVPVLLTSARTGEGLGVLRHLLDERVAARRSASARLAADVTAAAERLAYAGGREAGRVVDNAGRRERDALIDALATTAGVPTVTTAVAAAHQRRGARATGWPFTRWHTRLLPDPLRRLRLSPGPSAEETVARTSLPPAGAAELARARIALSALLRSTAQGLPPPWPEVLRRRGEAAEADLSDLLDRVVATGTIDPGGSPRWWRVVGAVQWLLAGAAVVGAGWLVLRGLASSLQLGFVVPIPPAPLGVSGARLPLPTALLLGGIVLGLAAASCARMANRAGGRRRARTAQARLRERVAVLADRVVIQPVDAELRAYRDLVAAVRQARG